MPLPLKESIARCQKLPRTDAVLWGRAQLLEPADRDLVEVVLIRGEPAALMARIQGASPKRVRARVRQLGRRLASRRFVDAARALAYLDAPDAELARLRFCGGLGLKALSGRLGRPVHQLRRRLDRIAAQIAVIHRIGRPSGLDRFQNN